MTRQRLFVAVWPPEQVAAQLAHLVGTDETDCGSPVDPRSFVGHLTLGRIRRGAGSRAIGAPASAAFAVDEVSLVSSTLTPTGPDYRILRRFPCGG